MEDVTVSFKLHRCTSNLWTPCTKETRQGFLLIVKLLERVRERVAKEKALKDLL